MISRSSRLHQLAGLLLLFALFQFQNEGGVLVTASASATTTTTTAKYTAKDDVSWAITHPDKLNYPYHQELYNKYMAECNKQTKNQCQDGEEFRIKMNAQQPAGVYNFTQVGFTKLKMPQPLWELLHGFWETNQDQQKIEWKQINPYHNMWEAPPHFVSLENQEYGGGDQLRKEVWRLARPVLEEWTGQRLTPVSMYGIRIYKNNSILAPHVDRMPLVTSCILNIAQDLDEDWPLEVFDHDGNAHNVSMQPGDMVLYESHSVIHGRPFPMKGRSYVNAFLHFEPIGPLDDISKCGPQDNGLPPYIIKGGIWEDEYWRTTPRSGWKVSGNPSEAIKKGDIRALEYMAEFDPEVLHRKDYNGWAPIHEAVYGEHKAEMEFLFEHGAMIEDRVGHDNSGPNVLGLAKQSPYLHKDHEIIQYLLEMDKPEL